MANQEQRKPGGWYIKLADGTEFEGRVGYSEGFLWCWFSGMTMQEASVLFFDPEKTAVIVFEYGGESDTYEGFTFCKMISIDVDKQISVCMIKDD